MQHQQIGEVEWALRAAIRRHAVLRQARREAADAGRGMRLLLAGLGFASPALDIVAAALSPGDLPAPLGEEMRGRLAGEAARLLRLARSGSPSYDLNRHICVARARAWCDGKAPALGALPIENSRRIGGSPATSPRVSRKRHHGKPPVTGASPA